MTKFNSLKTLFTVYSSEKNESFFNYKLSFISLFLTVVSAILWLIFGEFSGFMFIWKCLQLALLGHIILSVTSVINDYVFDVVLKSFFKTLWLLISFRVLVEILIF